MTHNAETRPAIAALATIYSERSSYDMGVAALMAADDFGDTPFHSGQLAREIYYADKPPTMSYAMAGLTAAGVVERGEALIQSGASQPGRWTATPLLRTVTADFADWYLDTLEAHYAFDSEEILHRAASAIAKLHLLEFEMPVADVIAEVAAAHAISEPHARYNMLSGFAHAFNMGASTRQHMEATVKSQPSAARGTRAQAPQPGPGA